MYNNPKLYDEAFPFRADLVSYVEQLVSRHLKYSPTHVLDPACGPGHWLGWSKATKRTGVDIQPSMVSYSNYLYPSGVDFLIGDMRHLDQLGISGVDFAINLEGTIGHLRSLDDLQLHLKSIARVMVSGGIYALGCPTYPMQFGEKLGIDLTHDIGWNTKEEMPYRFTFRYERNNCLIKIGNSIIPNKYAETSLRLFTPSDIAFALEGSGFSLTEVNYMFFDGFPSSQKLYELGDLTLVLRRT